jgi:hypothetical protein
MNPIRVEADGTTDLARVYLWLSRHRGQVVQLDRGRRLAFGVPISGARAVIAAVVLHDDEHPGTQLGGMVRALANRTNAGPVRLVFEGRSPAQVSGEDARAHATRLLDEISTMVADDEPVAHVA